MLDKRYSEKTESTRSSIRARLDAGNTEEELLAVVAWKQRHWGKKPEMEKFIRPSTLFRPGNFDNYLNEIPRDVLKATVDGTLLKVRNLYGKISHVTQEQFDKASPGFLSIV